MSVVVLQSLLASEHPAGLPRRIDSDAEFEGALLAHPIPASNKQSPASGAQQPSAPAAPVDAPSADQPAMTAAFTPSVGALATSLLGLAAASSTYSDSPRVAELLLYYRELSDHVVREGTAGWEHAGFGGVLTTEWQPESRRFFRPFSLVWLYDAQSSIRRNDDQQLPSHLKEFPLLPHWTFGTEGDGDCLMRALMLGDVAGRMLTAARWSPFWNAMLSVPRDPLWGKVLPQFKTTEDNALESYRQT